jgi:hypothetical protein
MIALFLALMALQVNPGPTGVASGIVLSSNGTPPQDPRICHSGRNIGLRFGECHRV